VIKKTDIPNDTITYAKMQNAAADNVVIGNILGEGEAFQELTAAQLAGVVDSELLIDEDDMSSDTDTKAPTQQSTKAYVDAEVAANAPDVVLLSSQTASSSSSIDFTGLSSTYHTYEIHCANVAPGTDSSYFGIRTSTDGGSSYDSGSSAYEYQAQGAVNTTQGGSGGSATYMRLSYIPIGSDTNEQINGIITVLNPSAAQYTHAISRFSAMNTSGGDLTIIHACGYRASTTAVDAVQVLFNTGNIASGTFKLYGYK